MESASMIAFARFSASRWTLFRNQVTYHRPTSSSQSMPKSQIFPTVCDDRSFISTSIGSKSLTVRAIPLRFVATTRETTMPISTRTCKRKSFRRKKTTKNRTSSSVVPGLLARSRIRATSGSALKALSFSEAKSIVVIFARMSFQSFVFFNPGYDFIPKAFFLLCGFFFVGAAADVVAPLPSFPSSTSSEAAAAAATAAFRPSISS
mmetsp:Transcript_31781/g.101805  ORF Transcript_31781/g.101805 Transcript_31781/m.101805 type:complete len:206 (+) Transcript_31781:322-939(+)